MQYVCYLCTDLGRFASCIFKEVIKTQILSGQHLACFPLSFACKKSAPRGVSRNKKQNTPPTTCVCTSPQPPPWAYFDLFVPPLIALLVCRATWHSSVPPSSTELFPVQRVERAGRLAARADPLYRAYIILNIPRRGESRAISTQHSTALDSCVLISDKYLPFRDNYVSFRVDHSLVSSRPSSTGRDRPRTPANACCSPVSVPTWLISRKSLVFS